MNMYIRVPRNIPARNYWNMRLPNSAHISNRDLKFVRCITVPKRESNTNCNTFLTSYPFLLPVGPYFLPTSASRTSWKASRWLCYESSTEIGDGHDVYVGFDSHWSDLEEGSLQDVQATCSSKTVMQSVGKVRQRTRSACMLLAGTHRQRSSVRQRHRRVAQRLRSSQ
jgi:hypothetical protein